LFKEIQASSSLTAVLVFAHGIEKLSVRTDSYEQEQQLQKLLKDYKQHLAGIYDASVAFVDLVDDVNTLKTELMNDPCETPQ
jgi:cell shape-determining protein MreC